MAFNETLNPYIERIRNHPGVKTELDEVFASLLNQSCIVDLGCGNGHFLQSYLQMNPQMKGVGVEKRFKRTFKTASKLTDLPASVLNLDVFEFLSASPHSFFDEVWVQFPDPWPKARHEKNRMVRPLLLREIHRVLKPSGRFCFRSDHYEYFEFLQAENQKMNYFPVTKTQTGDLFSDLPTTLFQRKFTSRGVPIYSCEMRALKSSHAVFAAHDSHTSPLPV
jgi:tRNA (guanine-N7-)-methyltransferase